MRDCTENVDRAREDSRLGMSRQDRRSRGDSICFDFAQRGGLFRTRRLR
jgi:hypothetical protein